MFENPKTSRLWTSRPISGILYSVGLNIPKSRPKDLRKNCYFTSKVNFVNLVESQFGVSGFGDSLHTRGQVWKVRQGRLRLQGNVGLG